MTANIRPATQADLRSILSLLAEMHDDTRTGDPEARELELFDRILTQPLRTLLVAEEAGIVVGTADVLVAENLSRHGKPWATVENLVVSRSYRRRGHGKALMIHAIRIAEELGCYKVQLVSNERRARAHSLYEHLGFDAPVRGFRRYLKT